MSPQKRSRAFFLPAVAIAASCLVQLESLAQVTHSGTAGHSSNWPSPAELPTAQAPCGQHATAIMVEAFIIKASLASIFEMVGTLSKVQVSIDQYLDKELTEMRISGTAPEILNNLTRNNELIYWFDGTRYQIANAKNQPRTMVSFNGLDSETVHQIIMGAVPCASESAIRIDPRAGVVHINAPRELQDAIKGAVENAQMRRPSDVSVIRFGVQNR